MKLTEQQVQVIEDFVNAQGIRIRTLRDDVVDHLCCVMESELEKGKAFEELLEKATSDLAPNGLGEIQDKTIFLLNARRIIFMKKAMYSIGFLGSFSLTTGVTLNVLRLPFGNEFFTVGLLTLLLVFIPLLAIDRYKVALSKALSVRLKIILGAGAAAIVGLSGVFKLLHLQGADVLLGIGAVVFALGFLPFYYFTMYKKSVSN